VTGARLDVVIPGHCEGCGLTIHPGAMRRDPGYLVARSCPRCARPLAPPTTERDAKRAERLWGRVDTHPRPPDPPTSCSGGWFYAPEVNGDVPVAQSQYEPKTSTGSSSLPNVASAGAAQTGPPTRAGRRSRSTSPTSKSTLTTSPDQGTVTDSRGQKASARTSPSLYRARAM
jgi:hypothetical protein